MHLLRSKPDPPVKILEKVKCLFIGHWRGIIIVFVPVIFCFLIAGSDVPKYCWCGYCLIIMGAYWMTECLPLAVTAFIPMFLFPISGVMSSYDTCRCYVNDTVLMFIGSLMLAYSVEQSGLHKRMAYGTIRLIGYSHLKLLLAICIVTTFVSMWITNTAATTMMVPIIFACLRVFDDQGLIKMYDRAPDGEKFASDVTVAYFCCATYSATVGGIGTLIGTGTNLVFKGLFESDNPNAPELLSFPKFSAFGVPYMIALEIFIFLSISIQYFGLFRGNSAAAKRAKMSEKAVRLAKEAIAKESKKLGPMTYWEANHQSVWTGVSIVILFGLVSQTCLETMVILLFGGAIVAFFCRSPQIFDGWADKITDFFSLDRSSKFIRDSALCAFVAFLMFLLPSSLIFFKNFTAINRSGLTKKPITSVLDWPLLNSMMPYSFSFLLGGGFAISSAASATGLNTKIAEFLNFMKDLPVPAAIFIITVAVILVTNFASNVAVANVFVPITMRIAEEMKMNPLYACVSAGFSASMCFLLPVGTPGNLIVQGAANIKTGSMVKCGIVPTVTTIIISWAFFCFFAPLVWPEITDVAPDSWKKQFGRK